jgi:hypothetical protein
MEQKTKRKQKQECVARKQTDLHLLLNPPYAMPHCLLFLGKKDPLPSQRFQANTQPAGLFAETIRCIRAGHVGIRPQVPCFSDRSR